LTTVGTTNPRVMLIRGANSRRICVGWALVQGILVLNFLFFSLCCTVRHVGRCGISDACLCAADRPSTATCNFAAEQSTPACSIIGFSAVAVALNVFNISSFKKIDMAVRLDAGPRPRSGMIYELGHSLGDPTRLFPALCSLPS
jgi:hypothetical protein